jgi:hypothetical protein
MTMISTSQAFPSTSIDAGSVSRRDDPIRMDEVARRDDIRIEAGRQLRMSLWLVAVIATAFVATLAARPQGDTAPMLGEAAVATSQGPLATTTRAVARISLADLR